MSFSRASCEIRVNFTLDLDVDVLVIMPLLIAKPWLAVWNHTVWQCYGVIALGVSGRALTTNNGSQMLQRKTCKLLIAYITWIGKWKKESVFWFNTPSSAQHRSSSCFHNSFVKYLLKRELLSCHTKRVKRIRSGGESQSGHNLMTDECRWQTFKKRNTDLTSKLSPVGQFLSFSLSLSV